MLWLLKNTGKTGKNLPVYTKGAHTHTQKKRSLKDLSNVYAMFLCDFCPYHFQWWTYSITAVGMYVLLSVRNKTSFCSISFEKISVLDSNFIHMYIVIKCRLSLI